MNIEDETLFWKVLSHSLAVLFIFAFVSLTTQIIISKIINEDLITRNENLKFGMQMCNSLIEYYKNVEKKYIAFINSSENTFCDENYCYYEVK